MSEIFYSEVDKNLQAELNARGQAGRIDRGTESINFMLSKIANVKIIAYENSNRTKILHTLGGEKVRYGEYLPTGTTQNPGFLQDRTTDFRKKSWASNADSGELEVREISNKIINSSKRIPPYISSTDVSIGDHSYGLLNKATININIPNPQEDLDFFEAVWLRPGRHILIVIENSNSAVITQGLLSGSLPSTEKIKNLNPNISDKDLENFKKMNRYEFYGLLTNFNFNYNNDASVSATLNLTGTSNVYTDMSLLMSPTSITDETTEKPVPPIQVNTAITTDPALAAALLAIDINSGFDFRAAAARNLEPKPVPPPSEITGSDGLPLPTPLPIYDDLENELNKVITEEDRLKTTVAFAKQKPPTSKSDTNDWIITGKPYDSGSVQSETYITLSWLVNYMNDTIINKMIKSVDKNEGNDEFTNSIKIICDETVVSSNYYESITSADPNKILLMDKNQRSNNYGKLTWYDKLQQNVPNFQEVKNEEKIAYPSRIFINIQEIHDIIEILSVNRKEFNVTNFFAAISNIISSCTGNAINLSLITHPELQNTLLFYDANRVRTKNNANVKEYSVPMFANHPYGTIVQQFSFSAKIPNSVRNLSYVLNQDPNEISESEIAPYMNFMYNSGTVVRTNRNENGTRVEIQNPDAEVNLMLLKNNYKKAYETNIRNLKQSKINLGLNPTDNQRILELKQALIKYIQYPTPVLTDTNQITAPMYPFDVDITIDGINGFRYGDVLQFDALPIRYRRNSVFCIININHIVTTNGSWTTQLKCIMRPKFE